MNFDITFHFKNKTKNILYNEIEKNHFKVFFHISTKNAFHFLKKFDNLKIGFSKILRFYYRT